MSSRPVYTLLMGGLGNQMFQYAVARAVAVRGNGAVRLDTSLLEAVHADVTPRTFGLGGFEVNASVAAKDEAEKFTTRSGVRGLARRVADRVRPLHLRRVIYEKGPAFQPDLLRVRPPVYLSGFWQSEKYFADVASTIRSDFQLRDALSPLADQYLAEMRSCDSVSVHVRRGDYTQGKAMAAHGLLPSSYYSDAVRKISQPGKKLTAFVFSDDIDWVRKNIELDAETRFVELGAGSEHAEILLMAACNHHVISNSTFGWWGAWLGEQEGTRIVAPRLWFADPSKEVDIIPDRWMRA